MIDIADAKLKPRNILVSGNSSQNMKMLPRNFRIATVLLRVIVFDNNKFVTHAIQFDVDKHALKPESITIINQVYQYLT